MTRNQVNNRFYDELDERWYSAEDDPVALLRAESRLRNPWILSRIRRELGPAQAVLDVGCGAGFLANALARSGHVVTGLDRSKESLAVARHHDATASVGYVCMDAHALAFRDTCFDVVCAMDFLEHTDRPKLVLQEVARVLKPGGLFFFHTFNRNPLSYLVAIKGVEWFVRNTPERLHVHHLFIKPRELVANLERSGLTLDECTGVRPQIFARAFWRMLLTGRVPEDFAFVFSSSRAVAYSGMARKDRPREAPVRV